MVLEAAQRLQQGRIDQTQSSLWESGSQHPGATPASSSGPTGTVKDDKLRRALSCAIASAGTESASQSVAGSTQQRLRLEREAWGQQLPPQMNVQAPAR